jgi:hypothetical protein
LKEFLTASALVLPMIVRLTETEPYWPNGLQGRRRTKKKLCPLSRPLRRYG